MTTGPIVAGGLGGQVLQKRADSNMTDWVDASALGHEKLAADRDYYVATTGSDEFNDGRDADHPFGSIQKAIDVVARLDLDFQFNVFVHVAHGYYLLPSPPPGSGGGGGLQFKDPQNWKHRNTSIAIGNNLDQSTYRCILEGDPDSPESVILDSGPESFSVMIFIQSGAWRVSGFRVMSTTPIGATLIYLRDYSTLQCDSIDFHFAAEFQNAIACVGGSYCYTGPLTEVQPCRLSKSGPGSIIYMFISSDNSVLLVGDLFDCQGTAIDMGFHQDGFDYDGAWYYCAYHARILDINWYYTKQNITGGRKAILVNGGDILTRRMELAPGALPVQMDGSSVLRSKNSDLYATGELLPAIDPVGGPMMEHFGGGGTIRMNGRTISNKGATAMVQYELPGNGDMYYSETKGDGQPWGFRFGFLVMDADGIRVTPSGGFSIRVGTSVGGKIEATALGSSITLLNVSENEWVATSQIGTWTVTPQIANTVAPVISPTTGPYGGTMTCSPGTWATTPAKVFYQWLLDGVEYGTNGDIGSANPTGANMGYGVYTCRVSMIDVNGVGSVQVMSSNSYTAS